MTEPIAQPGASNAVATADDEVGFDAMTLPRARRRAPAMNASGAPFLVAAVAVVVSGAAAACAVGRGRVDAPVVELTIPPIDGGTAALQIIPGARTEGAPAGGKEASLTGRWEGTGTQNDGLSWPMIVTFETTTPGVCATVEYPSLPCRAEWRCLREREGTIEATEHLTGDSALRCVDNGTMTMRVTDEGRLEWEWSGQGQSAAARLRRSP